MNTQVKTREELKALVAEALALPTVKDGDLFIAGVTKVKDYKGTHQMMLEIVQKKNLRGGKTNLLQVLNLGDDRFRASSGSRRVWLKITEKGFDSIFAPISDKVTGAELVEKSGALVGKEILGVFTRVNEISVDGEIERPTISVKQYSAENGLPSRIQKIMDMDPDTRSEADDAELENLAMQTAEGEPLVDAHGNQVFEINEFTYGEDVNVIIAKMPLNEWKKQASKTIEVVAKKEKGLLAELTE